MDFDAIARGFLIGEIAWVAWLAFKHVHANRTPEGV